MSTFLTKIEGHGSLEIDWKTKKVQLKISEGERLFEGIICGRPAEEAPWIVSRICGVCPIAHNLACLKAIETALDIKPDNTAILLRRLMAVGQIIQSHSLHLFFLALPDYLGLDNGLELAKKKPEIFQTAIQLKEIGDEIAQVVAGRGVHPTTTTIGGFHKIPSRQTLNELAEKLNKNIAAARNTPEIFSKLEYPNYQINLELVSQTNNKYYPDCEQTEIISSTNEKSPIQQYKNDIREEIRLCSTAKFGRYKKREVMVGALTRLFTHQKRLNPVCQKYLPQINFQNPFHNNFAQAIEILHYYQTAQEILKSLLLSNELKSNIIAPTNNPPNHGFGALEAPRGGLYYEIRLDENKKIAFCDIITPTVQNLLSIEKSAQAILAQSPRLSSKKTEKLLEMLVRAYDPCLTCAVH